MGLLDIFTIVSNAAFLSPLDEAFYRQLVWHAMVYLFVIVSSSLYHSCNSLTHGCLGLSPDVLRNGDFYFAQLCIPLIALSAIKPWMESWWWVKPVTLSLTGFGLYFAQRYLGNSLYVQMLVAGLSFGAILVYWGLYALRQYRKGQKGKKITHYLPKYIWRHFALGIGLSALAVSLYAAEMLAHGYYFAVHSCWHLCAAFGQTYMLKIWVRKEVRLYEESAKHGHRGHRVAILEPLSSGGSVPHLYAIPLQRRGLVHVAPKTRAGGLIVKVNER
jgi:vacuolar-type H+-ATPase subunit I/STV1